MRNKPPRELAGRVRIIGGRWRGRNLTIPESAAVRPTPNRARETLFNWLAPVISGARCLDVYAGTGALGFEALSRGASQVCFIERDAALATAIKRRAAELGADPEAARVVEQDAEQFLGRASEARFEIAFLDPPYATELAPLLALLKHWLAPQALVYVERGRRQTLADALGGSAEIVKQSRAGSVVYGLVRAAAGPLTLPAGEG
jgi:16S rRNA (guanine966-N2)-methyltransferase